MKTKMTAVAMVAVMIAAAFAVVGMADSGAADESTNVKKEKDILGTADNPYILNYSADTTKNEKVTASIEFNRFAFSDNANVEFKYQWKEGSVEHNAFLLTTGPNTVTHVTENRYKITLTPQSDTNKTSVYTVQFEACKATPANLQSEFTITVTITDKTDAAGTITLPEQSYAFKAYVKAVDASEESIQLNGNGVNDTDKKKINFEFEKDYSISSKVVVNGTDSTESFNYYAVGLPDGISMTVDGKIGGRLSNSLKKTTDDVSFTVYAMSTTGHVVSQSMTYSIGEQAKRGFTISVGNNEYYATTTVNKNVTLTITPNDGTTLKNVVVSYDGHKDILNPNTITATTNHEIQCTGTGILKVSVSAQVEGSNVTMTKTVTVYVVGEIFDTDLDPEVTN